MDKAESSNVYRLSSGKQLDRIASLVSSKGFVHPPLCYYTIVLQKKNLKGRGLGRAADPPQNHPPKYLPERLYNFELLASGGDRRRCAGSSCSHSGARERDLPRAAACQLRWHEHHSARRDAA